VEFNDSMMVKNKLKSRIKSGLLVLLSLVVLGIIYLGWTLEKSKPPMDGQLQLKNLKSKVVVTRDQSGIPHIQSENEMDGLRALGFTVASDRLFQMDVLRRLSNGTLSEVFGEKALNMDITMRTLKFREAMTQLEMDPLIKSKIEAYFDGVNQYIESATLPIEFLLLRYKPSPFTVLDAYTFIGYMSYSFEASLRQDPLMTKLLSQFPNALVEELRYHGSAEALKEATASNAFSKIDSRLKKVVNSTASLIPEIETYLRGGFAPLEGSNAWLISKEKSESGFPILANDPHIAYSLPEVWYEAHLKSPEYEMYGHHLPLLPFPVLGHNRNYGWGFTMSIHDDMDLYQEKIQGEKYQFKNDWLPLTYREEEIPIKGEASKKIKFYETQHGPLLDHILAEKGVSLKWSYFSKGNDALKVLHGMGHSQNIEEFKQAISAGICPGLNIMYADKTNIMWWIHGEFSKRPPHVKSDFILDGASGNDEPLGYLSFEEKPHSVNPKEGFIVTANSNPPGFTGPGDWQPDDRFKTLMKKLSEKEKWNVEETKKLQTWNSNIESGPIRTVLLKNLSEELKKNNPAVFEAVNNWNLESDIESVGATIFHIWNIENIKILTANFSAEDREAYSKLGSNWMFYKRVISNPENPWLKYLKLSQSEVIQKGFTNTLARLEKELGHETTNWKWGRIHTVKYNHPLGKIKILDPFFSLGPYPSPGYYNDVNNMKHHGFDSGLDVLVGPSTRRIIDFAHPENAHGILPVGNSGHSLSPFYKDQIQMYLKGEYRAELLDETLIKEQGTHVLELGPL
jgi:penicillin amidase